MSLKDDHDGEEWLRSSHVAELLHVSPKTISRYAREEGLPHMSTPLGGHRRFKRSEVLAWWAEQLPRMAAARERAGDRHRRRREAESERGRDVVAP